MVQKEVSYKSPIADIKVWMKGTLTFSDEVRKNQHQMVRTVMSGLLTPFTTVLPFMAGIVPCEEWNPEWLINAFGAVNKALVGERGSLDRGPRSQCSLWRAIILRAVPDQCGYTTLSQVSCRPCELPEGRASKGSGGECKFLQESGARAVPLALHQFFADS